MKKQFLTFSIVCACCVPAFGQGGGGMQMPSGISAEVKQAYTQVKNNLIGAANAMPEANYDFAPVPEEMTFGKWVAHVADSNLGTCSGLNGAAKRGDAATKTTKADLVAALQASFAECVQLVDRCQCARDGSLRPRSAFARGHAGGRERSRQRMLRQHGCLSANQGCDSAFDGESWRNGRRTRRQRARHGRHANGSRALGPNSSGNMFHKQLFIRIAAVAGVWASLMFAQTPAPAVAQAPAKLVVSGDVAKPITLGAEDLAAMPREKVSIPDQDGTQVEYEGVTLREILQRAGTPLGNQLRGKALTTYVLAKAHDGYQVVFALGEIDASFGNGKILVVDKRDGKALFGYQGPLRLVCPDDKAGARSVRMLETLEVVQLQK